VHFAKTSGNVLDENEVFKYTVRTASTVGAFAFPTVQTYETGEIVRWIGAPGSEEPAPVLNTLAANAPPPATTPATAPRHARPPTTSGATVTTKAVTAVTNPAPSSPGLTVAPPPPAASPSSGVATSTIPQRATTTTPSTHPRTTTTTAISKATNSDADRGIALGQAAPVSSSRRAGRGVAAAGGLVLLMLVTGACAWRFMRRRRTRESVPPVP